MKDSKTTKTKIAELQQEVETLRAEVEGEKHSPWRGLAVWTCAIIATAMLVAGNLLFWVGNTLVNTDRYVAAVGPLIQKPEIQTAIATYTTDQIFKTVNVEGIIKDNLPPRAVFLAPQLTTQAKTYTNKGIKGLLANQKVQDYWYKSLAKRHDALITFSKEYEGNGTIEVSDIYTQLSKQLSGTKLSFLAGKALPENVGSIKVATAGWLPIVHNVSKNIGLYQAITTLLFLGLSALAIVLSRRRRATAIALGIMFSLSMLVSLVAIKIAGGIAASEVALNYQTAVHVAYDTVLHSFVTQTTTILLLGLLLAAVAWLSGPYKSAEAVKSRIVTLLSGKLHKSLFGGHENGFTKWVAQYKRYLQWGSVLLISMVMLAVQLSPKLVAVYGLVILALALLIELLAADK
ncbi:MAG TPA: hypothetical protein VK534_02090 [Methylomirabilota bacterium]|nr:hypothetical protein [Methylomirabilota bacterium]